jgi:hypothetical protein
LEKKSIIQHFSFSLSAVVTLFASLSNSSASMADGALHFHSGVPAAHQETVIEDLKLLERLEVKNAAIDLRVFSFDRNFIGPHPDERRGLNLSDWFMDRVKYLLWEDYDVQKNVTDASAFYLFPKMGSTPSISSRKFLPLSVSQDMAESFNQFLTAVSQGEMVSEGEMNLKSAATPLRSSLGENILGVNLSYLYAMGKSRGKAFSLNWDNGEKIDFSSPRVGMIQVGKGIFPDDANVASVSKKLFNRFFRLSVLLHEARHSDGKDENTGFGHILCPVDHVLAMEYACDLPLNGAYTVSSQFLSLVQQNATSILREMMGKPQSSNAATSAKDFEDEAETLNLALKMARADMQSRVSFQEPVLARQVISGSEKDREITLAMAKAGNRLNARQMMLSLNPEKLLLLLFKASDFAAVDEVLATVPAEEYQGEDLTEESESAKKIEIPKTMTFPQVLARNGTKGSSKMSRMK